MCGGGGVKWEPVCGREMRKEEERKDVGGGWVGSGNSEVKEM